MGSTKPTNSAFMIGEMTEYGSFTPQERTFIAMTLAALAIRTATLPEDRAPYPKDLERVIQKRIDESDYWLRLQKIADLRPHDPKAAGTAEFIGTLTMSINRDLARPVGSPAAELSGFSATRYLYERMLDPAVRPWLPAAFCAASALPNIFPQRRKVLLQTLSAEAATASTWSAKHPTFYPDYVAK